MQLRQYDADDRSAVLAGMEIINACRDVDTPWIPPVTAYRREMQVRRSWDGSDTDRHYLAWVDGVAVAVAQLEIGEWDNRDFAWLFVFVHPEHRRRGHGSAVLHALEEVARDRGCTKFGGAGWELPATEPFAKHHGFEWGSAEVSRVQRPLELPPGLAESAYAEAAPYAEDYELIRLVGATPEDLMPAVVRLSEAINDAPIDDLEIEPEVFTPERVRGYETTQIESGYRFYRVLARHRESGELAGHSVVVVEVERPAYAHQHDTSVLRTHRGHRLGLLLKADMMRWLAEIEPQVERIDTWNAESNDHMIAVNERLGYQVVGRELEFQRRL